MTGVPPLVEISELVKTFIIGADGRAAAVASRGVPALIRLLRDLTGRRAKAPANVLKALDGLSLEGRPGEVLGIIGRNGAGKTTLLKILARVHPPTGGQARLRGRVLALLELGATFAPELTVSETVEMFGLAAGVTRRQASMLVQEIIELADLRDYDDVPMRHCPAGSFVRLCFAALVRFPAEIVLADEVLAVGDADFREACEQRMLEVAASGGLVMFVSHDLNALRRICTRIIWLDRGRVRMSGEPEDVITAYVREVLVADEASSRSGASMDVKVLDVRLADFSGGQIGVAQLTEPFAIECLLSAEHDCEAVIEMRLNRADRLVTRTSQGPLRMREGEVHTVRISIPGSFLNDGVYEALFTVSTGEAKASTKAPLSFRVLNADVERSVWANWKATRPGLISPPGTWTLTPQGPDTASHTGP
jgi:lipopolysaccharide transport system ATP-binding protein